MKGARRLRTLLPGDPVQRRPVRRLVRRRGFDHRCLLPAELPRPATVRAQCPVPADCGGRSGEGFRACKRCRPDASPGSPEWNVRSDVVARAMRLIADGTVDRDGVSGLAAQLGYTIRQLERLLQAVVGAGPLALARAQRMQTARVLIETTNLPFGDVAFAAGFSSIRQFNDTVRLACDGTPTALRARAAARFSLPPHQRARCRCGYPSVHHSPSRCFRPSGRHRGAGLRRGPRWCVPTHATAPMGQRHRQPDAGTRSCALPACAR